MNQFLLWRISVLRDQKWLGIKCELVPSVSTLQSCFSQLVYSNGWCPPVVPQSWEHQWLECRQDVILMHLLLLLFNHSVMSDSLWPHGLQHARLPCPLLAPGVCSNSCPLSRWCYPTISSSATVFSSCLQSFPASQSFLMTHFFPPGDISALPMNIQGWFL